jgi:hypothetical protein
MSLYIDCGFSLVEEVLIFVRVEIGGEAEAESG